MTSKQSDYTVTEQPNGTWAILLSEQIQAVMPTNAAAWRWIDQHDAQHADAIDRHNRIRNAFAK